MTRENSRWVKKRYDNIGLPICLVESCNEICEQFKNGNYRNYCKNHSWRDISPLINWQSLREKALKRDCYQCVKCGDDREIITIKVKRRRCINLNDLLKNSLCELKYEVCTTESTKPNLEVDHIKEVSDGGNMWDLDNLQTLCYACHKNKTIWFNSKAYSKEQSKLIKYEIMGGIK